MEVMMLSQLVVYFGFCFKILRKVTIDFRMEGILADI
jgi:hypothetical protein